VLLRHDLFTRLCRARDLLREPHEAPPSIKDIAREGRHLAIPTSFDDLNPSSGLPRTSFESNRGWTTQAASGNQSAIRTDVCMEVGFISLAASAIFFARRVGATPSAYQRRARVIVPVPGPLPQELFPGCSA